MITPLGVMQSKGSAENDKIFFVFLSFFPLRESRPVILSKCLSALREYIVYKFGDDHSPTHFEFIVFRM